MTTPILNIQEVSDGQINQYITYNNALRSLEASTNDYLSVSLASGNVSLTADQFTKYFLFSATGNAVARSLIVLNRKRLFCVYNGGTFELSVVCGTSTIGIPAASSSIFYTDGSANGLYRLSSSSSSGMLGFASGKNSSAPNAVVPVLYLRVDDGAVNADVSVTPKGSGAFTLQTPDGASAGGNKRGDFAVDLQLSRVNATQVASGALSFAAGANATASGIYSCALQGGVASGTRSYSWGQGSISSSADSLSSGASCLASANNSYALGVRANSRTRIGSFSWASGMFSAADDAQEVKMVLRAQTSDATTTALTADASSATNNNQLILADNSSVAFGGKITARQNSTGDVSGWEFSGVIKRGANAASTVLVAAVTPTKIAADTNANAWSVSVVADTNNGGLRIDVTGQAAKIIRWVCVLDCCELSG